MNRFGELVRIIVFFAVVLACGLCVWNATAVDNHPKLQRMEYSTNPGSIKVSFVSQLQLPSEAMVYRVKTKPVSEERIRELIKLFNMPDPDTTPVSPKGKKLAGKSDRSIKITKGGLEGSYYIPDKDESLYVRNDGIIVYN